ncbi:MAG: twitch domain-containing radical SAM protein [Bdellovibrionales bacterium]|nr:twitch domain-containing radical SAM protein [Bdellovibrionales bacterium]
MYNLSEYEMRREMENKEISRTFCVYPWIELIVGPTKHLKLCCIASSAVLDSKGVAYDCSKDNLKDYWNSEGLREVRKKMLQGESISSCDHCYYQESIGRISYRQSFNKQWLFSNYGKEILKRVNQSRQNDYRVEENPLYLDIRPGNLCNLSCRMCNPGNSSKIYKEQKELLKTDSGFKDLINEDFFKGDEKEFHNWYKKESLWKSILDWTPSLRQLYFTGGEPTLIKENWKFINYLQEKDFAKNIDLIFNLNCTQVPDKLINTFSHFKSVTITLSIDGYKEVQEYIRYPSKWKEIENNVIKLVKNRTRKCLFYLSPVVQVYNILNLVDIFDWRDRIEKNYKVNIDMSLIMCTGPEYFDIENLPSSIKEQALSRITSYERKYKKKNDFFFNTLSSIKNVLRKEEKKDLSKHLRNFFRYTSILDRKRSNDFSKSFGELNELLNKDGRWKS